MTLIDRPYKSEAGYACQFLSYRRVPLAAFAESRAVPAAPVIALLPLVVAPPATPVDSAVVLVVVVDIALVESVVLAVLLLQAATAAPIMAIAKNREAFCFVIPVLPPLPAT